LGEITTAGSEQVEATMNVRWMCGALGIILLIGVIIAAGSAVREVPRRRALVVFRGGRPARCRGPGTRLVLAPWERAVEIRTGPLRCSGDYTCYSADPMLVTVHVELEYEVVDGCRFVAGGAPADGRLGDIIGAAVAAHFVAQPLTWTIAHPDDVARPVAARVAGQLPALGLAARSLRVHQPRVSAADLQVLHELSTNGHGLSTNGLASPTDVHSPAATDDRRSPWPRPVLVGER
jgi:hypothetical protein